jgi:hypothetical protein
MEHIASLSFGADSMATVILAHIHGEPLDAALYCEVMFDKTISGEVPEHRDFIYNTAIPALEQWGIKTIVLRSESTMKEVFYTRRTEKSRYCGKYIGFPMVGRCELQKRLKLRPIHAFLKDHPDAVQYVGIATDEKKRLRSLDGKRKVSLLAKYGLTQDDARELCSEYGLLSPIYSFAKRGVLVLPQRTRLRAAPPQNIPPRALERIAPNEQRAGPREAGSVPRRGKP